MSESMSNAGLAALILLAIVTGYCIADLTGITLEEQPVECTSQRNGSKICVRELALPEGCSLEVVVRGRDIAESGALPDLRVKTGDQLYLVFGCKEEK